MAAGNEPDNGHVAFLRGMNVGGHRITNDALSAHVRALGFEGVSTYQASGNVLFESAPVPVAEIEAVLAGGLEERLGYAVPVFVRSASSVRAIATAAPFGATPPTKESKPQVMLCASELDDESRSAVMEHSTEADQLAISGAEIHWRPTVGISTSALDLRTIERIVGGMTVRTLATIERIADRL